MLDLPHEQWVVLLVDDDADNLEIARFVLAYNGAEVHTAEDGQEALDRLQTLRPTFILMDLSMPVMDGWTALERIRTMPEVTHTPVIALTAHAMHGDEERALAAGFDDYITKPFRADTLLQSIRKALEQIRRKRT